MSPTAVPENSCILILGPSEKNLEQITLSLRDEIRAKFISLNEAANIAEAPRYFSTYLPDTLPSSWISAQHEKNQTRIFTCSDTDSAWHNSDLVDAIKSENRERLFICGFWLDIDLGPTAIEAYVSGYNVHILLDLTFSKRDLYHEDGISRLRQMGIVPMLTSQLVHEWMSWTTDQNRATALRSILDNLVG